MTLTNRLLVFFLGALAVVLAGFSTGVYLLADRHLYRQADERLKALDNVLAAAIENDEDGLDFDPGHRSMSGPEGGFLSLICDESGRVINGSQGAEDVLPGFGAAAGGENFLSQRVDRDGRLWKIGRRTFETTAGTAGIARGKHAKLTLNTAVPLGPVQDTLGKLAMILAGLSVGILAVALVSGRAVCRRALVPVSRMASAARGMGAADFGERLPVSPAEDELADLGRSFNGLLERMHESFERQRRFTGDAAHQLRTPLAAVVGQADVALRRDRPADEYRQALESVRRQAGHLSRIVDALLFLARVDADAGPPPAERLDLAVWLPEQLRTWAEHPRAGDLQLEKADGPAWVQVPPALLGELVNNLLDNALKYSEPGTVVTVRLGRESGAVMLSVEDRGRGIDPTEQAGLFRPFFRSADARRRGIPGVGLGLAVAARLAKAFGGDITATSEPGRGSCFRVRLPVTEPIAYHPA
jgi:signal transduction histidine kinase